MLKKTIEDEMKQAMKAKEEVKLGTLRMLISSIRNREIEKRAKLVKGGAVGDINAMGQLNDEETLDAVRSEMKKRRDAIAEYNKANRPELAQKESNELAILQSYLPAELSDEEIEKLLQPLAAGASEKDFGRVMGLSMKAVGGRASGDRVGAVLKRLLERQEMISAR